MQSYTKKTKQKKPHTPKPWPDPKSIEIIGKVSFETSGICSLLACFRKLWN